MSFSSNLFDVLREEHEEGDRRKNQKTTDSSAKPASKPQPAKAAAPAKSATPASKGAAVDRLGVKVEKSSDGKPKTRAPSDRPRKTESGEERRGGARGGERRERPKDGNLDRVGNKRPFDRKSGTGRGKETKKGGSGKANWGSAEDEAKAAEAKPAEEGAAETKPAEGAEAKPEEGAAAESTEPAEPEVKEITFEEYLKQKNSKTPKVGLPKARSAGEGVDPKQWKDFVPLKRELEETPQPAATKEKKQQQQKSAEVNSKVPLDKFFEVKMPSTNPPEQRRGRGPRGAPRQNNPNPNPAKKGQKKEVAPNVADTTSFPALSVKA